MLNGTWMNLQRVQSDAHNLRSFWCNFSARTYERPRMKSLTRANTRTVDNAKYWSKPKAEQPSNIDGKLNCVLKCYYSMWISFHFVTRYSKTRLMNSSELYRWFDLGIFRDHPVPKLEQSWARYQPSGFTYATSVTMTTITNSTEQWYRIQKAATFTTVCIWYLRRVTS